MCTLLLLLQDTAAGCFCGQPRTTPRLILSGLRSAKKASVTPRIGSLGACRCAKHSTAQPHQHSSRNCFDQAARCSVECTSSCVGSQDMTALCKCNIQTLLLPTRHTNVPLLLCCYKGPGMHASLAVTVGRFGQFHQGDMWIAADHATAVKHKH